MKRTFSALQTQSDDRRLPPPVAALKHANRQFVAAAPRLPHRSRHAAATPTKGCQRQPHDVGRYAPWPQPTRAQRGLAFTPDIDTFDAAAASGRAACKPPFNQRYARPRGANVATAMYELEVRGRQCRAVHGTRQRQQSRTATDTANKHDVELTRRTSSA